MWAANPRASRIVAQATIVSRPTMWAAPELSEQEGRGDHPDPSSLRRAGRLPISAVPGNPPDSYAPGRMAIRPAPWVGGYYPARSVSASTQFRGRAAGVDSYSAGFPDIGFPGYGGPRRGTGSKGN
jgi:hypothetical protein